MVRLRGKTCPVLNRRSVVVAVDRSLPKALCPLRAAQQASVGSKTRSAGFDAFRYFISEVVGIRINRMLGLCESIGKGPG
jgi:hypothetical protein